MAGLSLKLVDCAYAQHARPILDLLNAAIVSSTALYDYHPRTPGSVARWFESKAADGFPVIGAVGDDGQLLGFSSYGRFRAFPAYKYTVEHSVYVRADHQRRGIGRRLLEALIERARAQEFHVLIGAIDVKNAASIALHERLGFACTGTLPQVGFKFGRWLDLALYQLLLDTPREPVDG